MSEFGHCPNCNAQITKECAFCPHCGISLAAFQTANGSGARIPAWKRVEMEKAAQEEAQVNGSEQSKIVANQPMYEQQSYTYVPPQPELPDKPMKWYKFIIYFQLIAGAVVNSINALNYLLGSATDLIPYMPNRTLYAFYSGLQAADVLYGLAIIGLVIFALIVRSGLRNFKATAPNSYLAYLVCTALFPFFYSFMVMSAVPEYALDYSKVIGQIISHGIIILLNYIYFKKREHLFCYV